MNNSNTVLIKDIREFNRFYTNFIGLLDQHILESEYSLAEARILFEIGHSENCTAKKLNEELRIDRGYLSRVIKRFEREELVYRVQSKEDGRLFYLFLTDKGKDILFEMDDMSSSQIRQMISFLPEQEQLSVVESMKSIKSALLAKPGLVNEKYKIRCDLRPGDVGYLIHMHGWIYAEECGYNHEFEGYVCKTFYNFFEKYSPDKDRLWFAEYNGKMIGAIAIVGHSTVRAQLRWFIVDPSFRGDGIGRALLNEAMKYCKEKKYKNVYLETTEEQISAIRMYTSLGFEKVAEHERRMWGKNLAELTYELELA